jgi:hypothetical protein
VYVHICFVSLCVFRYVRFIGIILSYYVFLVGYVSLGTFRLVIGIFRWVSIESFGMFHFVMGYALLSGLYGLSGPESNL